jgi:predicted metalloprotease with PDZ domain
VARNTALGGNVSAATVQYLDFARRYVEGREPLPVDSILSLAALRVERVVIREPRFGITTQTDSSGFSVASVVPGGSAAAAGVLVGDHIVSVGDIPIKNDASFADVRSRYAGTTASSLPAVIRRGAESVTVQLPVRLVARSETRVTPVAGASPRAVAIRHAIFFGSR